MTSRRRLLTIGHSYCVALNRRLPHEIARSGDWDVTAVGPARFHGDFGLHTLEPAPDELASQQVAAETGDEGDEDWEHGEPRLKNMMVTLQYETLQLKVSRPVPPIGGS